MEENYREIQELISQAFDKAKSDSKKLSKPGWYKYISDNLDKTSPSERTLERYYKKYIEGKFNEIGRPKEDIIDEISIWLGHISFADFCNKNFSDGSDPIENKKVEKEEKSVEGNKNRKGKKSLLVNAGLATLLGIGTYFGLDAASEKSKCMFWDGTHYEIVDCVKNQNPNLTTIPYNEGDFNYLKKIAATDTTTYFRAGEPIVWYLKIDGEVEFYSSPGNHPITGKQLKPVTPYIVDKYIFANK